MYFRIIKIITKNQPTMQLLNFFIYPSTVE